MVDRSHLEYLKRKLERISGGDNVESLATQNVDPSRLESVSELDVIAHEESQLLSKVQNGDIDDISVSEAARLEAIVERVGRPVAFATQDGFEYLPNPWEAFNDGPIADTIRRCIPSVGRVELVSGNGAWGQHVGSGFLVGEGLIMTNRHVAEVFVSGVGDGNLVFRPNRACGFDTGRRYRVDHISNTSATVTVSTVKMIHPYWDMALFELDSVPANAGRLTLSTESPDLLAGRKIITIGYPGRGKDTRRVALDLEEQVFGNTFGVKRIAPGEIDGMLPTTSYNHSVDALIHDISTLAGHSGSPVIDVESGFVIGLHFKGATLKRNYSVPAFELARDPRVQDAGVSIQGNPGEAPGEAPGWGDWWERAEADVVPGVDLDTDSRGSDTPPPPRKGGTTLGSISGVGNSVSVTIPLHISVSLGNAGEVSKIEVVDGVIFDSVLEAYEIPVIYDNLEERSGYSPDFLELGNGDDVPLPELTALGREKAAPLADGSVELKYHKFSIVMHKERRLALFTAANVDWRENSRRVDGRFPTRKELSEVSPNAYEQWTTDHRIDAGHQLPDVFFTRDRAAFDKGHLVRRNDITWGDTFEDIQMANGDTYHTTNCSPQVRGYNRSSEGKFNWGDLENMVEDEAGTEKSIVLSGPVFARNDRRFHGVDESGRVIVKIPRRYWKIIVAKTIRGVKAFGFIPKQSLRDVDFGQLEFTLPNEWRRHLVPISEIEEKLYGLVTLDWYKDHDAFPEYTIYSDE